VILPVPIDLIRPFLGEGNGSDGSYRPPQVRRREEREAERLYEEAVGEARSEQRAVQELEPDGTNSPPVGPASGEEAATAAEVPRKAVPPDAPRTEEPPPRMGDAPPSPSEQPPR
jgi:hypothetical protein